MVHHGTCCCDEMIATDEEGDGDEFDYKKLSIEPILLWFNLNVTIYDTAEGNAPDSVYMFRQTVMVYP